MSHTNPGIERSSEKIDEQTALEYLEHNRGNRSLRARFVQHLANEMLNGNWHQTTSAIGFRPDGSLTDGQHRLHAVVTANKQARNKGLPPVVVQMDVVRNIPEGSMAYR